MTLYETEGVEKASRSAVSPELMAYAGEALKARNRAVSRSAVLP